MTIQEATRNHEEAKARYSSLVSQTIRNEVAIAEALRQHRATRIELDKFAFTKVGEGFRWNR